MIRMLVLWAVMVVLFVAFYVLFAAAPGTGGPTPGEGLSSPLKTLGIALLVVCVFAFFLWRARSANDVTLQGVSLLQEGRYAEALTAFRACVKQTPGSAAAHYNVGLAALALWQVAEADAAFEAASKRSMRLFDVRKLLYPAWSLAAALLDRPLDARRHLDEADKHQAQHTALARLALAVLGARSRDWVATRAALEVYAVKMLSGSSRGLADALHAWALEQLTGERRYVDRLGLYGETGPDVLKAVWPELVAFVERAPST